MDWDDINDIYNKKTFVPSMDIIDEDEEGENGYPHNQKDELHDILSNFID